MAAKKPKRPKAPKASASLEAWKKYDQKLKDWKKKCTKIESDKKAKKTLIDRVRRSA